MWGQASATPETVSQDRGALILEEPPETVARRARGARKGAAILAGFGVGLIAFGALFGGALYGGSGSLFFFLGLLLGPIVVVLGLVVFRSSRRLQPMRFYENGLEAHALVGDRTLFVSYGEVLAIQETKVPLEGEVYRLQTSNPGVMIGIARDMPGAAAILDRVRSRMGRPEFVVKPPAAAAPQMRRFASLFPVIALVIAAVAAAFVVLGSFGAFGTSDRLLVFGLVFPLFGIIAVTYASLRMRALVPPLDPGPSMKLPVALVAGLLVLGLVGLALVSAAPGAPPPVPEISPRPPATALTPGIYENQTIGRTGVVRVDTGESLVLRNTSLTLGPSGGTLGGVWVAQGGALTFENVTVRGAGSRITFEILGSARILRSDLADLAGDPEKDHTDGGLEIYSSDVLIDGTTIHDTATNGVFVVNASPEIRNSSIVNAGDDCIELQSSAARIENSTITGCGWAMVVWVDSAPWILGNRFVDNEHGVHISGSDGRIENNTFDGNGDYAIRLFGESNPTMQGNAFLTSADDVERGDSLDSALLCGPVMVGVGAVCLGLLYRRHRRDILAAHSTNR